MQLFETTGFPPRDLFKKPAGKTKRKGTLLLRCAFTFSDLFIFGTFQIQYFLYSEQQTCVPELFNVKNIRETCHLKDLHDVFVDIADHHMALLVHDLLGGQKDAEAC